ncbi:MAG: c-type cytochrome [Planctomycetes bacterium]|nr:c-type cytochrome [Planctomycetota bacterium]
MEEKYQVAQAQFALCATHSHTTPHLDLINMINLYATPMTKEEQAATKRYGEWLTARIVEASGKAIEDLRPGKMFTAEGKATFAVNRRVIKDGIVGMRPNPDGPVDHSVPILKITDESGQTVRGLVFNYACHCTTFNGNHNRVNGDWAGYATKSLEETHPDAVALCTIGCGADANPKRNSGNDLEVAQAQGKELADEVDRLQSQPMKEISAKIQSTFGYAGLPIQRPTADQLKEKLKNRVPQVRRHAERMLATLAERGRLPDSYPMPIQVWRFGDQLTMVFLGGEVCVEYALRTKREITKGAVWVTAYANDVFGYVAPESMQTEGGYEVDFSMIFYNQPGRWANGTEEIIFRELHQLYDGNVSASPLSPEEAIGSFTVPEGFSVEVVAAEPLVVDPINFAIGADGRLWVVEMSDYPRGANDDGKPGGCVKVLTDVDGDGRYDKAEVFLDGLTYPTGVLPWRDGALVSCVPDIFLARDTNGDGQADQREVLVTGFSEANPQHQMSGFTRGLDNWIYVTCGDDHGTIRSVRTGKEIKIGGRDIRLNPDTGELEAVSGRSQYGRCRDDWNRWFGNTNGEPLLHYVIEDHYLARNSFVPAPSPRVAMTDPPVAPPVYPTSRTINRFNDLFDANRFTSACGPLIFRDTSLGHDTQGVAFICEPVHNLVSRLMLSPNGVTFTGSRHPDEQDSEFFSSSDTWCRPVRLATGPDGALWIADMYRQVIEHPEWISEGWQAKLDLYAGNKRGRIYRVFRTDKRPTMPSDMTKLSSAELVKELGADNGWRRDIAQELLVQRNDPASISLLNSSVSDDPRPLARLHALAVLDGLSQITSGVLETAINDASPHVVARAILLTEPLLASHPELEAKILQLEDHSDPNVRLQLALTLGELKNPLAGQALLRLAVENLDDFWLRAAVLSSAGDFADEMLTTLFQDTETIEARGQLLQDLIATSLGQDITGGAATIVQSIAASNAADQIQDWQFTALASCISALAKRNITWSTSADKNSKLAEAAQSLFNAARQAANDESSSLKRRQASISLLGNEPEKLEDDLALLESLLTPREPPELQRLAVHVLARIRPPNLADRLLADWSGRGPLLQSEIVAVLLTRGEWVNSLIQALSKGTIQPHDLNTSSRWRLLGSPDPRVRETALEIFGENSSAAREEIINDYKVAELLVGDTESGAKFFKKICATCHSHAEIGQDVGPKLAALQDKSAAFLTTAILDPNRAVDGKFYSYTVVTQDGVMLAGMIVSETANSIELVDPQGKKHTILRIDIEELASSGISFMPEGLEKELSPQDLADVMAFLRHEPTPK